MNYVTAGESHGPALVTIVSDAPAGVTLSSGTIDADLARRQAGYGRGQRMQIEKDVVQILSGVRFGKTLGSPIALKIDNKDWASWSAVMAQEGARPDDLVIEQTPRPGHADLVGALKNDTDDCRDILERASARETAARVAAGAVAKAFLTHVGVEITSYVTRVGSVELDAQLIARTGGIFSKDVIEASEMRCPDEQTTEWMRTAIDQARAEGESLGGWFNVCATGLVPGLGDYAQASGRLTGRLGGALFSIPAIRGVEFGMGFETGRLPGSSVHDEIIHVSDKVTGVASLRRATNNAGGIEGGMTNGEPLIIRAAMKPIPTLMKPLHTVHLETHEEVLASKERSDVCAVPAAAVVAEAEVALVLADAYTKKFGSDTINDIVLALEAYAGRILG